MEHRLTPWHKRREAAPCEPVEAQLNVSAFLDWLNRHASFASNAFCVIDAMFVGRPVLGRNELCVYLVFHHYATNTVAASPFEFHPAQLEPFLHKSVLHERAYGQ